MRINSIKAKEILTSKASPTMEVCLETTKARFFASVPSGVSTGKYEAKSLPAKEALQNIEDVIAKAVAGKNFENQKQIDDFLLELDGTENKSCLGANAILPVSAAACRAFAAEQSLPLYKFLGTSEGTSDVPLAAGHRMSPRLPVPCFNILEGGEHANNNLSVQEFMIVPQLGLFGENYQAGKKVYQTLKDILVQKFGKAGIALGMENGFAPPLTKIKEGLDFLQQAIGQSGLKGRIVIGLDIAASELVGSATPSSGDGLTIAKYDFDDQKINSQELLSFYEQAITSYPILFLEDPFDQDDEASWREISSKFKVQSSKFFIVGDDLTTTNPQRIRMAKERGLCNGVIIKLNQIGTVSQVIEAANLAKSYDWKIIVSHRSGETNDDFIADLAVGIGADFIKSGAPFGSQRLAKYNRLLEIEKVLK